MDVLEQEIDVKVQCWRTAEDGLENPGLSVSRCSFISLGRGKTSEFYGVQQRARVLATVVHARPQTRFTSPDLMQTRAMSQIALYCNCFRNEWDFFV